MTPRQIADALGMNPDSVERVLAGETEAERVARFKKITPKRDDVGDLIR
jgi:hypothetical protein